MNKIHEEIFTMKICNLVLIVSVFCLLSGKLFPAQPYSNPQTKQVKEILLYLEPVWKKNGVINPIHGTQKFNKGNKVTIVKGPDAGESDIIAENLIEWSKASAERVLSIKNVLNAAKALQKAGASVTILGPPLKDIQPMLNAENVIKWFQSEPRELAFYAIKVVPSGELAKVIKYNSGEALVGALIEYLNQNQHLINPANIYRLKNQGDALYHNSSLSSDAYIRINE